MAEVWDQFVTEEDRRVLEETRWGATSGFGHRPAVLVVDATYAFVGDRDESIHDSIRRWRTSCGSRGWHAMKAISQLLLTARENDVPVIYTKDPQPREDRFERGAWAFKVSLPAEGVTGSNLDREKMGKAIVQEISPEPSDLVIEKLKPSAFLGTPLLGYLVSLGVDSLIICGGTTSGCVRATVVDAFSYNYRVTVVEECVFDRFDSSHAITLFDINAKYADVVKLDAVLSHLAG